MLSPGSICLAQTLTINMPSATEHVGCWIEMKKTLRKRLGCQQVVSISRQGVPKTWSAETGCAVPGH